MTTNLPLLNVSEFNYSKMNTLPDFSPMQCLNDLGMNKELDLQCVIRHICPQLGQWAVNTGIVIIVAYILVSWFLWWFMKYGYKLLPLDTVDRSYGFWKYVGDLREVDTRVYWDTWIRSKLTLVCLGYIVVNVYINW